MRIKSWFSTKFICYYLVALVVTWLIWLPLAMNRQLGWNLPVLPYQHYLGSFGPLLSALLIVFYFEGRQGLLEFVTRSFRIIQRPSWFGLAVLVPVALFSLAVLINGVTGGAWPAWGEIGTTEQLPGLPWIGTWLFWMVTFGLGEETGWRGFALQELQQKMRPVSASMLLGLLWALWHLPAFFYDEQYMAMGIVPVLGWLLSILYGSVVFTWLRNSTGGSIVVVAVWHGTFDMLIASDAATGLIPGVMSMGVIVIGIILLKITKGQLGYKP